MQIYLGIFQTRSTFRATEYFVLFLHTGPTVSVCLSVCLCVPLPLDSKDTHNAKVIHNSEVTHNSKVTHNPKVAHNSNVTYNLKVTHNSKVTHTLKVTPNSKVTHDSKVTYNSKVTCISVFLKLCFYVFLYYWYFYLYFCISERETVASRTSDMVKKTVAVLAHSFLLPYSGNSVYILCLTPLRYSRS